MAIGCVICTEEFSISSSDKYPVVLKNCGHVFHDVCLKLWLKKSKTCPICRNVAADSPAFIGKLHLQRLSLDNNPTVSNLLDETIELRSKLDEKDEELQKKDGEIKKRDRKIVELQAALNEVGNQVKNIDECLKNLKKIQNDEKIAVETTCTSKLEVGCSVQNPAVERRPMIRHFRISSVSNPSTSANSGRTATISSRPIARVAQRGRSASSSVLNIARRA